LNGETGNQAAYAAHREVSRKTVTGWKQRGLLVFTEDDEVDFDASDKALRKQGILLPEVTDGDDDTGVEEAFARMVANGQALLSKADAERVKENYAALLKQLEYDRQAGSVAEIDDVVVAVASELALVRNRLLNIGSKVAPRLVALRSAEEIKEMIDEEVIAALNELTIDAPREDDYGVLRESIQGRFKPAP